MSIQLFHGDCLQVLPTLEAGSVDMVLCDLPYGLTRLKWDSAIPLEPLWEQYKRLIKPNGAIVLFGSQPFTSALVMSNPEWFRYEWIWEKSTGTGFLAANRTPLKCHENILVFSQSPAPYSPQMRRAANKTTKRSANSSHYSAHERATTNNKGKAYPRSIIYTIKELGTVHPTQKPVDLLAYLIRTYTNKGDTVLDNCMGSGSTGVACVLEGRSFVGIENDTEYGYFEIAQKRIHEAQTAPRTLAMELTA